MNQHNGMRPQDIVLLLKILIAEKDWMSKHLAQDLFLSPAEVSYSLQRSAIAGLLDPTKRKVLKNTFLEFIQYGLPRVFPAIRGPIATGVPTSFSSPVMSSHLMTNQFHEMTVWPHAEGVGRGETIQPLYPNAVLAALKDPALYDLLSLVDVMRMGKVREKEIALRLLKQKFNIHHA